MKGAQIVNEHGAVNFNGLHTRDVEAAKRVLRLRVRLGHARRSTAPSCGRCPATAITSKSETRAARADRGVRRRPGFEDVVASINPIGDDEPDVPAHWSVTFSVDDADVLAARAAELGGHVLVPPLDAPWARMTVIADPQGASFIATQFVPENR